MSWKVIEPLEEEGDEQQTIVSCICCVCIFQKPNWSRPIFDHAGLFTAVWVTLSLVCGLTAALRFSGALGARPDTAPGSTSRARLCWESVHRVSARGKGSSATFDESGVGKP